MVCSALATGWGSIRARCAWSRALGATTRLTCSSMTSAATSTTGCGVVPGPESGEQARRGVGRQRRRRRATADVSTIGSGCSTSADSTRRTRAVRSSVMSALTVLVVGAAFGGSGAAALRASSRFASAPRVASACSCRAGAGSTPARSPQFCRCGSRVGGERVRRPGRRGRVACSLAAGGAGRGCGVRRSTSRPRLPQLALTTSVGRGGAAMSQRRHADAGGADASGAGGAGRGGDRAGAVRSAGADPAGPGGAGRLGAARAAAAHRRRARRQRAADARRRQRSGRWSSGCWRCRSVSDRSSCCWRTSRSRRSWRRGSTSCSCTGPTARVEQLDERLWASEAEMTAWLSHLARTAGRTERQFNAQVPMLVMRLGDGLRLAATRDVSKHVSFALRRNTLGKVTLADLVGRQMLHRVVADLLRACMRSSEIRIVFSGPTGSGQDDAGAGLPRRARPRMLGSWSSRTRPRSTCSTRCCTRTSSRGRPAWPTTRARARSRRASR